MKKLVYISAGWCSPCKMFSPIMSKVSLSGIPVEKVDADSNSDVLTKYGVRNIPTVIKVDNNGNMLDKFVGVKSEQEVINFYSK